MPSAVAAAATAQPSRFLPRSKSWGWSNSGHALRTSHACRRESSGPGHLPCRPLASSGTSSTPALAAMPLLLVVDGESCYGSLQSCLLTQVLQCGRLYGCHTIFLEFLTSQMTSANLASSLTSNWWSWAATRSLRSPERRCRKIVLKMWPAGSFGGRAAIITSSSSVGLRPPSSAPHRMLVH